MQVNKFQSLIVRSRGKSAAPYLFLIPASLYFLVFWIGPFIFTIWISMTDWNILGDLSKINFNGFSNYVQLFTEDSIFLTAVKNTFIYAVINTPLVIILGLGLAFLLRSSFRGRTIVRTLAFLPYGTSLVALAIIWRSIYSPTASGVLNIVLSWFNIENQGWLSSATLALPSIMIMDVWKWTGYTMVIFLVALANIPSVYYDAAQVDGANNWLAFRHITLPLLRPTFLFTAVTGTIGAFQVFAQVYVMTQGGPANSTEVVVHYMYQVAFKWLRMGDAAAMAMVLLGFIMIFVLSEYRLLQERH
jgi:ABC-type sugar transport system permease subunit